MTNWKRNHSEVFHLTKFQVKIVIILLERPFGMATIKELDAIIYPYSKVRWPKRVGLVRRSVKNRDDIFRFNKESDTAVLIEHLREDPEWVDVILGEAPELTLASIELQEMKDATHIYRWNDIAHLTGRPCKIIKDAPGDNCYKVVTVRFHDGDVVECRRNAIREINQTV
ncbi:hypothetical protein CMI37_31620 [Candidatus Pacearchaeota archaeon]|nr:hypothetical protein [Candidatus Pacearchaeota archaeon]|tara:strand:- start:668 stop:1177 length:510 start_codon:yes stop_codon:yes gene_type:complete